MEKLKHMKTFMVINAIVMILIGILILIDPGGSTLVLALSAGIGILISGILQICHYFSVRKYALFSSGFLVSGIIECLLGVFMFTHPTVMMLSLSICISIFLFFGGVNCLETAFQMKHLGLRGWVVNLILAVIILLGGGILLFFPFATLAYTVIYAGVLLILNGIVELINCWRLRKVEARFYEHAKDIRDLLSRDFIDIDL